MHRNALAGEARARMQALKRQIIALVCDQLEAEASNISRAARAAHDAATHEEAKPENDKDTRSVEAAYLAGAQAKRAAELSEVIARLKALHLPDYSADVPIASGALVTLSGQGQSRRYLLLPVAGGFTVRVADSEYSTTTPSSPLGAVLTGSILGDAVEYETPAGTKDYEIVELR